MIEETTDKLIKIAGVRFRENWKVYDFDATNIDVAVGDRVIVDSERGTGFAAVVRIRRAPAPVAVEAAVPPAPVLKPEIAEGIEIEIELDGKEEEAPAAASPKGPKAIRKILRKATEDDIAKEKKNREREAEAFSIAQDMIAERELPMKLIRVEYTFDASRATFYFFSENRIDFRELVKDLAYKLKSRIEMRQIGVRDVARMIGGFGPCGRELCCSSFLKNFEPVSIRMAKKQEMVLNPAKISGVCGRLLCCLSYEYDMYEANKRDLEDMRQSAVREKKEEEERRVAEERRQAEEQRLAEEKKRQEERRQQQERRDRHKGGGQKSGSRPGEQQGDKKKEPHEKKPQPSQPEQQRQRHHQPKPERQPQPQEAKAAPAQPQEQKAQQPHPEGEKAGKRKRRRFWRRKKKGNQQPGENKPTQGPNPPGPAGQ